VNKDEYILFSVCFATRYIHSGELKIFKSNERRDEAREKRSASKKRSSGTYMMRILGGVESRHAVRRVTRLSI